MVEWKINEFGTIFVSVNDFLMKVFTIINKEFDKSNFNFLTFWFIYVITFIIFNGKVNISVRNDAFSNYIFNLIHDFKFGTKAMAVIWVFRIVIVDVTTSSDLIFSNVHSALGQAPSLSDINLVAHSHVLNALDFLDQDLFFLQSVDGE